MTAFGLPIPAPPPPPSTQVGLGQVSPAPRVPLSGFTGTGGRLANIGANFLSGVARGRQLQAARKYQQEVHGLNAAQSLVTSSRDAMNRLASTAPDPKQDPKGYQQWWSKNGNALTQLYQANTKARQDYINYVSQYVSPVKGKKGGRGNQKQDQGLMGVLVGHIKKAFIAQPPPLLSPQQLGTMRQVESAREQAETPQTVVESPEVQAARLANQQAEASAQESQNRLAAGKIQLETAQINLDELQKHLKQNTLVSIQKVGEQVVAISQAPDGELKGQTIGAAPELTPQWKTVLSKLPPDVSGIAQGYLSIGADDKALGAIQKYQEDSRKSGQQKALATMKSGLQKSLIDYSTKQKEVLQDRQADINKKLATFKASLPKAPPAPSVRTTETVTPPGWLAGHFGAGPTTKVQQTITRPVSPGESHAPATHIFSVSAWIKGNPKASLQQVNAATAKAKQQGYQVTQ